MTDTTGDAPILWEDSHGQVWQGRYLTDQLLVRVRTSYGRWESPVYAESIPRADLERMYGTLVRYDG